MTEPRVLLIDNFDSFTYNLVDFMGTNADVTVVTNRASLAEIRAIDPDAIVISPGPGHPENDRDVGVSTAVLREVSPSIPTLGVCLGLEAAVHAYGGTVGHAPEPVHGKSCPVYHDGTGIYDGIDQGFQAGRYHSLVATAVPECFSVTATTPVGEPATNEPETATDLVMGIRHRTYPIEGVQFHPESVLTPVGRDVLGNFLATASQSAVMRTENVQR